MTSAFLLEGCIIGLFVIADGLYVTGFPPVGDEPQGIALIAIGIFLILVVLRLDRTEAGCSGMPPGP